MSQTIAALGERALIERLRTTIGPYPPDVLIGIGDDAAVLQPERNAVLVVTTDCLVEGVHFRREWTAPRTIGHKALAVNLSDLAAMGAMPRACLLSLALPDQLPLADFDEILEGFTALARTAGTSLVGGNMASSPGPIVIDVTAIGSARRRRILRRDTARAGHELYVTGTIGAAAAGLALRAAGRRDDELDEDERACVRRYEQPDARVRCGWIVARSAAASGAMDLSDGLASTAHALSEASGAGVTIDAAALPIHPGADAWARQTGRDPVDFALAGGEDYELAFAVPPRFRRKFLAAAARTSNLPVTCIGRFQKESGVWLSRNGRLEPVPAGFSHF